MSLIWASVIGFPWSFSSLLGPQPLALAIYHGWLVTWELRKWFDNSSASLCLWRYRFWVGCSVWGLHSAATLSVISCSVLPRSFHLWFQVAGIMPSAAGGDPPMSLGGQRACYFSQSWWLISIKSLMRALCDRCARSPPLNRHRFIGCVGEGISSSLLNLFWRFYDILLTLFWRFSGVFLALFWRFSASTEQLRLRIFFLPPLPQFFPINWLLLWLGCISMNSIEHRAQPASHNRALPH